MKIGAAVVAGATLAVGGMIKLASNVGATADRLLDLNSITGMSTDEIQKWERATKVAGVATEAITNASQKLTKSFDMMSSETDKGAEALAELGYSYDEVANMTADERMNVLTESLAGVEDKTERARIGTDLFGGSWKEIAPIVDLGTEAMKGAKDAANIISPEDLKKANDFRIEMDTMKDNVSHFAMEIGIALLPIMEKMFNWFDENMPTIKSVFSTAFDTIVTAIGDAVTAVEGIIDWFVKYKAIITPIVGAVSLVIINAWAVTAAKAVVSAIKHGIQSLKVVANWLLMGIKSTFHALVVVASWVATGVGAIKSALVTAGQAAIVVAKWLWMGVKSAIHALKVVASWVLTGAGAIAAGIVMIAQSAIVVAKWVWMGTQSLLHAGKMAAAWIIALGPIAWVATAVAGIAALIIANWDKIKAKTIEIFTRVSTWLDTKWTEIKTFATETFENMKTAISDKVEGIKDAIVTGITKAVDWIKALPAQALTWGKDIIMGIVNGIKNAASAVGDAVKGVAQDIRSFLHFSVPDQGPLVDFESWMPDFMGGLAKGIDANKYKVTDAIRGLAGNMSVNANILGSPPNSAVSNVTNSSQIINYEGIFKGATINVRNDNDHKLIAKELYSLQRGRSRGQGVMA